VSHSIDPRVVVEFERHPHPTMLAIRCLQTFSVVFHFFFVSHVKIATFEFFKPLKVIYQEHAHRKLRQAFDAILQQFSSNVTQNQCCPEIVVSRHKIRHVQRYYKLYCCMKLVLL